MANETNVYKMRTEGPVTIHTIKWTLRHFQSLLDTRTEREFFIDPEGKSKNSTKNPRFQIKMEYIKEVNNSYGHSQALIGIYFLSPNSEDLKIRSILIIGSAKFTKDIIIKEFCTVPGNKWQLLTSLHKSDIWQRSVNNHGAAEFCIEFMVLSGESQLRESKPQLSNDFNNLLNDGLYSDVTMKSAEGIEYKVHKAVLASRSAVLKATFEHNTTECSTNIVESHLESDILREVLTFIYSDKAPRVDEMAEKLLAAADYYQLNRLKSLCEKALHKKLTVENAIETLQLADLHSANTLKQLTLEFIKAGRLKLVLKTEGWAQLKSVELIKLIIMNEYVMADDNGADPK